MVYSMQSYEIRSFLHRICQYHVVWQAMSTLVVQHTSFARLQFRYWCEFSWRLYLGSGGLLSQPWSRVAHGRLVLHSGSRYEMGIVRRSSFRYVLRLILKRVFVCAFKRYYAWSVADSYYNDGRGGLGGLEAWNLPRGPVVRRPGGPPRQMLK